MESFLAFLQFVQQFGPWVAAILVALYFVGLLLDEDRTALFRARIYKAAFRLSGRVEDEKKYIANDVKGRLNRARRALHLGGTVLPRAVEVSWVEGGQGETAQLREGEFIVKLDPSANQERNIALLAMAVTTRTTLRGIRHCVDRTLQEAIDLNLVRTLLLSVGNREAMDWFLKHQYEPALDNEGLRNRNSQVVLMDERGLFTRLLLVELDAFAVRVQGLPPRPYMVGEIEGLVEFIYRIASRQVGEEVPLRYDRAIIRIGVILVAKTAKLLESIEPYVTAMQIHAEHRLNSVYVIVFDKDWLGEVDRRAHDEFVKQIHELSKSFETAAPVTKSFDIRYSLVDSSGHRRQARCIRYTMPGIESVAGSVV